MKYITAVICLARSFSNLLIDTPQNYNRIYSNNNVYLFDQEIK